MNLERSLSYHQFYYLRAVAEGRLVIFADVEGRWFIPIGSEQVLVCLGSKTRGRRLMKWGAHRGSSLVELRQRGLLVVVGSRVVPSREVSRQLGAPPSLPTPPRLVRMSRTRAARIQFSVASP